MHIILSCICIFLQTQLEELIIKSSTSSTYSHKEVHVVLHKYGSDSDCQGKARWRGGVCCGVWGTCAVCCGRSGGVIGILCLSQGIQSWVKELTDISNLFVATREWEKEPSV